MQYINESGTGGHTGGRTPAQPASTEES